MKKAIVITEGWDTYGHRFTHGEIVTQVGGFDDDGHALFEGKGGRTQFLDEDDFVYYEEAAK